MMQNFIIPATVSIDALTQLLDKLLVIKSVQSFEYTVHGQELSFKVYGKTCNLVQYKEDTRIFSVFDAYHILNKCIHAGYEAAKHDFFIGGYQMEDFVIETHKKDINVKLLINPIRIINILSYNYDSNSAPEVKNMHLLTEKGDFWNYGLLFCNLLKTEKQLLRSENDNYNQMNLLSSLQIQNQELIENLIKFVDHDHETRVGYDYFIQYMQTKNSCLGSIKRLKSFSKQESFDEVLNIRGLKEIKQIGQGSFGRVILVENKQKEQLAMKIIAINNQQDMNKTSSEAWFMFINKGSHFIVNIVDVQKVVIKNKIYIMVLQEYAQLGDLRQFMKIYRIQLGVKQVMKLFYDIANAIKIMAMENMIHRDIKPENILLVQSDDGSVTAKLADFGCDELVINDSGSDSFIGTPGYIAPEVFCGGHVSFPVDIWSIGIMLQEYTEEKELIELCLIEDPNKRATIDDLLVHLDHYKDEIVLIEKIIYDIEEVHTDSFNNSTLIVEESAQKFTFSDFCEIKSLTEPIL